MKSEVPLVPWGGKGRSPVFSCHGSPGEEKKGRAGSAVTLFFFTRKEWVVNRGGGGGGGVFYLVETWRILIRRKYVYETTSDINIMSVRER